MNDESTAGQHQLETASTLAAIHRLQEDRAYRDRRGLFFIEGVRNFIAAADYGFFIEALVYSEKLLINPISRKLVRRLKRAGVPFSRLSPEQFRSLSRTERASGVGAIIRQCLERLEAVRPAARECWTALSHVRSPGNFGALVRTSAATGSTGFILLGDSIDPFDPMAIRPTMGALFKQRFVRTTPEVFRRWTNQHRVEVIGASPDGAVEYDRFTYRRPAVLMLGTERSGLTEDERRACKHIVRIPMAGGIDSLNLAVAGSLLLYQVFRSSSP